MQCLSHSNDTGRNPRGAFGLGDALSERCPHRFASPITSDLRNVVSPIPLPVDPSRIGIPQDSDKTPVPSISLMLTRPVSCPALRLLDCQTQLSELVELVPTGSNSAVGPVPFVR